MKSDPFLHVCGSIIKKESIEPVSSSVVENTLVVEADKPYANYYGSNPEKNVIPNSLFLFTQRFYSLEEILRFTQKIDSCYMRNVNVASSVLSFSSQQKPAIRIKFFPDYEHIKQLQSCYIKQGVEFARKFQPEKTAHVQIHKCFVLEEIEPRIFLDQTEKDKAYIALPLLVNYEEFNELISEVCNNCRCGMFDTALAGIVIHSTLTDLIRVYAEKINIDMLHCIKSGIAQVLKHREFAMH